MSPDGISLYASAASDDAITRFDRDASTGALSYQGCITGNSDVGACTAISSATSNGVDSGLDTPTSVTVSADGASVYLVAFDDAAVVRFNRNTTTGALTYQSCITGDDDLGISGTGVCTAIPDATSSGANSGLDGLRSATLSADGKTLYATSIFNDAVAHFNRSAGGGLTYQGCITGETESGPSGSNACAAIPNASSGETGSGLGTPLEPVVSAAGASLYAVATADDAVARFDRDTSTGALTYQGCTTGDDNLGTSGSGVCAAIPNATSGGDGSGLGGASGLGLSPDGLSLYTAAVPDDAVARFDRNASTGALTYQGCISGDADLGTSGTAACTAIPSATSGGTASGLAFVDRIAVSPDGLSLYVGGFADGAVASFDRSLSSGALGYDGCITGQTEVGPAGSGACEAIASATAAGAFSGLQLSQPGSMEVSADGRSLYASVSVNSAVARLDRETPPSAASADTTAPAITLKGKKIQKGAKVVKVKVTVDEAASVAAKGTIRVALVKGSATAAKKRKLTLRGQSKELAAGETKTLKLKLKKKARKLTKRAQRRGKKARAKITVTATDAAGNESSAKRKVKLKKKR